MKRRKPIRFTVEQFFKNHSKSLQLQLLAGEKGLNRLIQEGAVNRPGLAFAGFYRYFAHRRIQVIGKHETSYLNHLSAAEQRASVKIFFQRNIPCVIFARKLKPPRIFLQEADLHNIPVFCSPLITMRLSNAATICLEVDFAPTTSEHGSMVDIQGIGVLIRGKSGVGKSEAVLGLIERGYSLVADDMCKIRCFEGRELIGSASDLTRYHMEIRGIGIIDVGATFGVGSIRYEKRIDFVATLIDWDEVEEIDRTGLEQRYYEILGIRVPHVIIPIKTGRDVARLVEVAALDAKLRSMGKNAAVDFNDKLLSLMNPKSSS